MFDPHEEIVLEADDIWLLERSMLPGANIGRMVVTTGRLLWFSNALSSHERFIARHEIVSTRLVEPHKFDISRLFGHSMRRLEIALKDRTTYRFEGARTDQCYAELDR